MNWVINCVPLLIPLTQAGYTCPHVHCGYTLGQNPLNKRVSGTPFQDAKLVGKTDLALISLTT